MIDNEHRKDDINDESVSSQVTVEVSNAEKPLGGGAVSFCVKIVCEMKDVSDLGFASIVDYFSVDQRQIVLIIVFTSNLFAIFKNN